MLIKDVRYTNADIHAMWQLPADRHVVIGRRFSLKLEEDRRTEIRSGRAAIAFHVRRRPDEVHTPEVGPRPTIKRRADLTDPFRIASFGIGVDRFAVLEQCQLVLELERVLSGQRQ